jgi:hypothetical protein
MNNNEKKVYAFCEAWKGGGVARRRRGGAGGERLPKQYMHI